MAIIITGSDEGGRQFQQSSNGYGYPTRRRRPAARPKAKPKAKAKKRVARGIKWNLPPGRSI
jgi:hypothetical protein